MTNVLLWVATTILLILLTAWGAYVASGRRWHKIVVIMLGSFAVFSTIWQGTLTYHIQRQAQEEQRLLRRQNQDLQKFLKTSIATKKDVQQLAKAHVLSEKEQKPSIPPHPTLPPPTLPTQRIPRIRYEERQSPSSVDWAPHSLQVIIKTDVPIENAGFKIECDGIIHNGRFDLVGHVVMKNVRQEIIGGTTFSLKFDSPAFTPDSPIIVSLLAKSAIRVNRIEQW